MDRYKKCTINYSSESRPRPSHVARCQGFTTDYEATDCFRAPDLKIVGRTNGGDAFVAYTCCTCMWDELDYSSAAIVYQLAAQEVAS